MLDWQTNKVLVSNSTLLGNMIIAVIIISMNIFSLFFFSRTSIFLTSELEKQQLESQVNSLVEIQKQKLEKEKYEQQLIHDIKNLLLASGNTASQKYLDAIEMNEIPFYTGFLEIDSVIIAKKKICDNQSIPINFEFNINARLNVNYGEIAVVLGIALDNAMEAYDGSENFNITLKISTNQNMIALSIENPITSPVKRDKTGSIMSSKSTLRGYGLKGIEFLTKEDNRQYAIDDDNGVFTVKVMFWA